MNFSQALDLVKTGNLLSRQGWSGSGMYVFLVQGSKFTVNRAPLLGIFPAGTEITYLPHLDIRTADGSISTWSPSQSDLLQNDWYVVPA